MSRKTGKQYTAAFNQIERKPYSLEEAVPLVKKIKFAKFDETVELHMRLGVDPKHADQMVRGTVVLPNGLGKSKKVLVIASGDKIREANEAGADFAGGEEMVTKIQSENWTDYDAIIATPDMMRSVGRLGKVLGPRGMSAAQTAYWENVLAKAAEADEWNKMLEANQLSGGFLKSAETRAYLRAQQDELKAIMTDLGLVR